MAVDRSIEGTYKCRLRQQQPTGGDLNSYGEMVLFLDGEQLKGTMFPTYFWKQHCFRRGTWDGKHFHFKVYYSTPCQQWESEVDGELDGDTITGTATAPLGTYQLTGVRVKK
ncbi:MAG: hypothetical protein IKH67_00830 [Lachnospiraceae bacterium]|nr:hypothetical protein [Lachnospiraceae bacterium]MBR3003598.1 hypothetical protein [Lachnospiraceae bacterium]MBR6349003.1 hypothetical protein [Lachnospiraceae bacterium]